MRYVLAILGCFLSISAYAIDDIFVDPSLDSDSGSGTFASPYGDLEYCLDNANSHTTGVNIWIKAGTDEILDNEIDATNLSNWTSNNAALSSSNPMVIHGWDGVESPPGHAVATIEGTTNSVAIWLASTASFVKFTYLNMESGQASGFAINIDNQIVFDHCILLSPVSGIDIDQGKFTDSYMEFVGYAIQGFVNVQCYRSVFVSGASGTVQALNSVGGVEDCILDLSAGDNEGILLATGNQPTFVRNTTIYSAISGSTNASGIVVGGYGSEITNNAIQGWGTTGGDAIELNSSSYFCRVEGNRFYACTTPVSNAGTSNVVGNSSNSAGALFTSPGTGDFTPTSYLTDQGWPTAFYNLSGNANYSTSGAIITQHSAGGTVVFPPISQPNSVP